MAKVYLPPRAHRPDRCVHRAKMRVLAGPVGRKAARETSLAGVVLVEISIWIWSEPGMLMMGLEMVEPQRAWGIASRWPSQTRNCAVGEHVHCIAWRALGESVPCANPSTTRPSSIQSTVYRNSIMRCRRSRVVVSGGKMVIVLRVSFSNWSVRRLAFARVLFFSVYRVRRAQGSAIQGGCSATIC